MPLNESVYRKKQREDEERAKRERAVELARGGSATGGQNGSGSYSTNSSDSSQKSAQQSQRGSQGTPAERALLKIGGRKFTDRLNEAIAKPSASANTNKTRTLDRTNERTYSKYDTESLEKENIRKNYEKQRDEFRKEHPVGKWLGAEGNSAVWGLDAELAKGLDFFLPDVITPKKIQKGLDYYKAQGEEAQRKAEEERAGSIERTILGTVGGESIKNIPSATMAYLSGGASLGAQVGGKAVPTLLKSSELTNVGNTFTRALNEVAQTTGKNPMFWETFARTIGSTYENEIANGADPVRATMSAYANALLNAQIEVGGGIEVYDPSEDFLKAIARSAKEEGLEEVEQYAVENLVNKAVGANTAKWMSLTRGEDAVINPVDMAEQGLYGALSGGLMSGGRTAMANTRAEVMDALANPVTREEVEQGMADQQGLVSRGLVQEREEGISTKAKSIAQELQTQLDRGEELQPNQVKRLIREINRESEINERSLGKAVGKQVSQSMEEGSFVEGTGLKMENDINEAKAGSLESRFTDKAKSVLGENASDNEATAVARVSIGTAGVSEIDTVLSKSSLKHAVEEIVNEGATADSKISIPVNNVEARRTLENLTAMKRISNRNTLMRETQEENSEDIKALLTNLNDGAKDLFAKNLVQGRETIGDVYQNRFYRMFYEGKREGTDFEDAYRRLITPLGADVQAIFTEDFARQIFAQGKASATAETAKATAKNVAEKYADRTSGVTYENNDESLISDDEKKGLEALAKAGDVEIRVVKSLSATDKEGKALLTKDGKRLVANGMYSNGVIYISADAKNKLITVAKHELTHYIKEMSPERYQELEDFVLKKWYKNDPKALAQRIEDYQRLYKDATPEEAREELIADASEAFFTDEGAIQEAVTFSKKLGRAIHDGIKHILDAFTGDDRRYKGYGEFMRDLGILREAERMWLEALDSSVQAKKGAKGTNTEATAETETKHSLGYHAGDLGKSTGDDYFGQGYYRGTGHFGFGTYFVGDKAQVGKYGYENRPVESVDFDKYNLYKPRNYDRGIRLHEALKIVNGYAKNYSELKRLGDYRNEEAREERYYKTSGILRDIDEFVWEMESDSETPSAELKSKIDKYFSDMPEYYRDQIEQKAQRQYERDGGEYDLETERYYVAEDVVKDYIDKLESDINKVRSLDFELTMGLGFAKNEAEIDRALAKTEEIVKGYPDNKRGLDSASTVFMKQLGYDGVDVRGIKGLDNTTYGSVIYDLKDEDLARKKEIGTAKYSVSADDQTYLDAVNRGDMDTAQRMVDEYAKKMGYEQLAFHGTNSDPFTVFRGNPNVKEENGLNLIKGYFSGQEGYSEEYGENVGTYYLNTDNFLYVEGVQTIEEMEEWLERKGITGVKFNDQINEESIQDWFDEIGYEYGEDPIDPWMFFNETGGNLTEKLYEAGYKGVEWDEGNSFDDDATAYMPFESSLIKSADPVTYDDEGNVIPLSERFKESNEDIRFSVAEDSDGNTLSEGQREYFKDSKVRDDEGRLLKMYHGTSEAGFTVFNGEYGKSSKGIFFTDNLTIAKGYSGTHDILKLPTFKSIEEVKEAIRKDMDAVVDIKKTDGKYVIYEDGDYVDESENLNDLYNLYNVYSGFGGESANYGVYLNATNPLVIDAHNKNWDELSDPNKNIVDREWEVYTNDNGEQVIEYTDRGGKPVRVTDKELQDSIGWDLYDRMMVRWFEEDYGHVYTKWDTDANKISDPVTTNFIVNYAQGNGYDGVIFRNIVDTGLYSTWQEKFPSTVAVVFEPDQIKLTSNENPTENEDIRYSVTTENEPLPKGGKIPKSMEKWAKKVGLETLSKQDSKVPVNVSVRSLRSYWYVMNDRNDEARTVNKNLRSVADALQTLAGKYKYIGLDDAINATVHYRTDEKGRPTSVYLTCQVKNAEYEINYDFTTICAKRAPLQKVLERFIKTEGERMDTLYDELKLDEEGMYKLRLILEQAGFEVSCIACFVEQNRYSQQAQAETVATDWNKALDEWAKENGTKVTEHFDLANLDLKSIPFEEIKKGFTNYYRLMREWKGAHPKDSANVSVKNRMLIEAIPYFRKRMNPSEYASIDGQRALMAMGNKKTNLYNLLKRGQGYAKQSVPFVAYNGEIALLPDKVKGKSLLNYLMGIGGARAQSASDFQIEYVYDYMQMVADLSARRLPMHMYTKVIELAELFGKTGIKINLSAMCDVDNSLDGEYAGLKKVNGKYVYNISNQSIDYNKAVALQRKEGYSKNIGIIMVTLSKYHMLKALGDKDVRYIIGYHSSKMPAVVSKASDMENATDYTKINKTNKLNDKGRALFEKAMSMATGGTELERYKNALRIFDDMIQNEVKGKDRPRRGNEYTRYMSGFKGNTADFDVYDDIKKTNDPRKTADNYIQYCMDNDLIPMYFPFAFHENYYKCEVYDFNMFDNNTGEYAPMEAVQNIYPDLDMTKGETDTKKFMSRVSRMMNAQNKKNEELEPMYQKVIEEAKSKLRIDIDGNDHVDMDETGIDPSELKHRADMHEGVNEAKQSLSEVDEDTKESRRTIGRLQKENETLKEAVWKRNEQISAERMFSEIEVQKVKRERNEAKRRAVNETKERYEAKIEDLKQRQKEKEQRAKERREEAEAKEKEHRKQVHERARARREASEARAKQEQREKREARRERKQDSEARTRLLNVAKRLSKIKSTDEFNRIRDQLIGNLDLEAKSMTGKTKMKLEDLEKWYMDQVENNDWFVRNEALEKKFERLRKTHISDMNLEDVQNLTDILLMLEHKVRNDKKLINSQYKKDVFMASFETAEGIKRSKGLKFKGLHKLDNVFIGQTLSPIRYMRRITGYDEDNPLMIATRELQKGEIASLDYRRRALDPFLKFTDMKFTSYLNGNKSPEIEVNATTIDMKPTTVKITPSIRIWFYLSSMNADNMRHIVNGGVMMPDVKLLKKGKRVDAYDNGTLVRFSKSQVQAIIDGMTAKEEAYARAIYNYFNNVAPEATNEVSETLDGITIAKVKNYLPIHVDDDFLETESEGIKMDGTLEGMGSHKERVQSAKPLYAEDISDILMRAIEADSKYVGMAIPIRNFRKIHRSSSMESARGQAEHLELTGETNNTPSSLVYGDEQTATYRTRTGGYVSVRKAIREAWTSDANKYIDKFLSDLQFPRSQVGDVERTLRELTSNYAGAVLTLNGSVAIKQTASFPTAGAVLGWKPLIKSFGKIGKLDLDYANSITPLLAYRAEGFNFREAGDIQNRDGRDSWFKRIMRTPLFNWIQGMDLLTTRKLFKASEIYVQDNFNLRRGSEAYNEKLAEIFNKVITETQPNYTVMERAGHLRSDSTLERTLSMFKTQPYQNFNIWYDATGDYLDKREKYKKAKTKANREALKEASVNLGRATTSQIAQLAVFAVMSSLWALARGKDDKYKDEEGNLTFASYLKQLAHDMLGGMASEFFLGSDVFSALDSVINDSYYAGFSSVTESSINDFFNTGMDMMKLLQSSWEYAMSDEKDKIDTEKIMKQMEKVVTEGGRFSGIPTGNLINLRNLMYRWGCIAKDGEYIGEYEAMKMSFAKDTYKKKLLLKAYRQDKDAYTELRKMMIEDGFKENSLDEYITGVIRDYARENPTEQQTNSYKKSLQFLEGSSLWYNNDSVYIQEYDEALRDIALGIDTDVTERLKKLESVGISPEMNALVRLAMEKSDKLYGNNNGSLNKEEKLKALDMLKHAMTLTDKEKDAILETSFSFGKKG